MIINTESGNQYILTNNDGTIEFERGFDKFVLDKMPVITFGKPLTVVGRKYDPYHKELGYPIRISTTPVVSVS
jgi:hypothetical protein